MQHARSVAFGGLGVVAALLLTAVPLTADAQELYGQTDHVTAPGGGYGGGNASEAQVGQALDLVLTSPLSRVADGFQVTGGQWRVTGFDFFGTSSDLVALGFADPYTYAAWRLWDRRPDQAGASVIGRDILQNALTGSSFTGAYRMPNGVPLSGTRPIDRVSTSADLLLDEGEYWLEWDLRRGDTFGTIPYITRVGEQVTGDAMMYDGFADSWSALTQSGYAQGLPFAVLGSRVVTSNPVPEPGAFLLLVAALPLLVRRCRKGASSPTTLS